MKISNSKKKLAQIIHENGGWREGAGFAWFQGKLKGGPCHEVWFGTENSEPEYIPTSGSFHSYWSMVVDKFTAAPFSNWHQTLLSREEYFHLHHAQDALRPEDFGAVDDYGIHHGSKPTIEQLAADYRNRKGYADRKQQEADGAKADAEAKLAELVAAGKALGLVLSVSDPEPELVITDWRDLRVGDVIELTGSLNPCWQEHAGIEMTVDAVYHDQGDDDDQVDLLGGSGTWSLGGNTDWRFIRRP